MRVLPLTLWRWRGEWEHRRVLIAGLNARNPDLVGSTVQVLNCSLVFDGRVDGVWASDHVGLVAELGIPQR
jgi:hypothetical protein